MPTYAYRCDDCGSEIEVIQKMSDDPLTVCESCGGSLKKRMFPVGIAFKGPGFYVNDYAKKDSGSKAAAPSASTTESAKPAEPAPESKPVETKPETKAESKPAATAAP